MAELLWFAVIAKNENGWAMSSWHRTIMRATAEACDTLMRDMDGSVPECLLLIDRRERRPGVRCAEALEADFVAEAIEKHGMLDAEEGEWLS